MRGLADRLPCARGRGEEDGARWRRVHRAGDARRGFAQRVGVHRARGFVADGAHRLLEGDGHGRARRARDPVLLEMCDGSGHGEVLGVFGAERPAEPAGALHSHRDGDLLAGVQVPRGREPVVASTDSGIARPPGPNASTCSIFPPRAWTETLREGARVSLERRPRERQRGDDRRDDENQHDRAHPESDPFQREPGCCGLCIGEAPTPLLLRIGRDSDAQRRLSALCHRPAKGGSRAANGGEPFIAA